MFWGFLILGKIEGIVKEMGEVGSKLGFSIVRKVNYRNYRGRRRY